MLFTFPLALDAQTGVTVVNERQEPLAGATVMEQATTRGESTDSLGRVELTVNNGVLLEISYVGYKSQLIYLKPDQWQRVILEENQQSLGSVKVEGFLDNRELSRQAGGIARLDMAALQRLRGKFTLCRQLIRCRAFVSSKRAGASYRISIRGSSVRSPFGVRNVKVYWNGSPFTEPGGNTFINLLDLTNVGSVEIIKGPAASIYGAGNGGVMKLQSTRLADMANSTSLSTSFGSFGFFRQTAVHNIARENSSLTVKFAHQQREGYREHNEMNRTVLEMDGLFFPDRKRTISTAFLYSNLDYQIPGGLNPDQRAENPRTTSCREY